MISRTQTIGLMMLALASLSVLAVTSTVQQASADQRATCEQNRNLVAACVQAQVENLCVGILQGRQECS